MRGKIGAWLGRSMRWVSHLFSRPLNESVRRGQQGETIAVKFLQQKGWRLLARNWRYGRYELDAVFRQDDDLVFVEVRARSSRATQTGYHSVTARKKKALRRVIKAYLHSLTPPLPSFRFDVLEVEWRSSKDYVCRHFENVTLGVY
ncbi:MAG: YraN family protein [Puniceicoccales bacterium]|nr:YraN family protein [Puniceicoccales bacterium]